MIKEIGKGVKRNFFPGLILQICAIIIAVSYYHWPASQVVFEVVENLKQTYGLLYAFLATSLFGGIIPFFYMYMVGQIREKAWRHFLFYAIFWAFKGVEADLFYTLQGLVFGVDNDLITVVKKTLVDQFIYAAFWVAPTISIAYLWVEKGFSFRRWRASIDRELFLETIPIVTFTNWLVWFPAVSVIYCMPSALQVPLFNLVVCYFVLMLAALKK